MPEGLTEPEITAYNIAKVKTDDEESKRIQAESEEIITMAKRKGYRLMMYGSNFLNNTGLQIKFSYNAGEVERIVQPVFKNSTLIGMALPDMGSDVPIGHHLLTAEITLNGQQYSNFGQKVLYNQVDPALTDAELAKMDEDEAKNQKKGGKKK